MPQNQPPRVKRIAPIYQSFDGISGYREMKRLYENLKIGGRGGGQVVSRGHDPNPPSPIQ